MCIYMDIIPYTYITCYIHMYILNIQAIKRGKKPDRKLLKTDRTAFHFVAQQPSPMVRQVT